MNVIDEYIEYKAKVWFREENFNEFYEKVVKYFKEHPDELPKVRWYNIFDDSVMKAYMDKTIELLDDEFYKRMRVKQCV